MNILRNKKNILGLLTFLLSLGSVNTLAVLNTDSAAALSTDRSISRVSGTGRVLENIKPITYITSPGPKTEVNINESLTINASAKDSDGIAVVRFYSNGILIGTDIDAPYSLSWVVPRAGYYSLSAKATDNLGNVGDSSNPVVLVEAVDPDLAVTVPAKISTEVMASSAALQRDIVTEVIVSNSGIIYAALWGEVHAYFPDGGEVPNWPFVGSGDIVNIIALSYDHELLYASTVDGQLHAVHSADSAQSGVEQWEISLSEGYALAPPLVDDRGVISLGSNNGRFYSVKPSGAIRWVYLAGSAITERAWVYSDYTVEFDSVNGVEHRILAGVIVPGQLYWDSLDDSLLTDYLDDVAPGFEDYVVSGWEVTDLFRIGRLFQGLLQRRPDRETLAFWTYAVLPESGFTLAQVADAFLQSDTGLALYGGLSDAAYLQKLYLLILKISDYASEPQYAQRLADLSSGKMSRAEIALLFTNSQRFSAVIDQELLRTFDVFYGFCLQPDCEFLRDTDNDGLADQWEIAQFGDLISQKGQESDPGPGSWDADGDGISNYIEYLAGTETVARIDEPASPAGMDAPSVNSDEVIASDQVGSTAGQFRVNESGAATYSIPIFSPAGTAGVSPGISLNYSSQGGNDILGKGWSIGGLSGISRCRQTLHQDGQALPITWSSHDRFCLDGQRLVKVSGASGTTYKTEIDSFVTVTSVGGSSGNPDHFTVIRKDGSISYYGATEDSQQGVDAHVMTWALNRFEDNMGNGINFQYQTENGHRIDEIRYAYGSGNTAANARLVFDYEDGRPDPLKGYIAGFALENRHRLKTITVHGAGTEGSMAGSEQVVREYTLNYRSIDTSSGAAKLSQLSSVLECAVNTAGTEVCLSPTQFT
jgi:Bacterial Ig domain/Salmonella virulence plasmid 65kDa B protein/Bacterial TSP3 repeat